jgi:hypothetical protein
MVLPTYQTFKNRITYRIQKRTGWKSSTAREIASNIVQHVKDTSGGGMLWKVKFDHGTYNASQYSTLDEFVTALEQISIPTNVYSKWQNRYEFKALQAKFQTNNAIEAVNAFTEKHSQIDNITFKEKFKAFFSPIKNDSLSLFAQTKLNYETWKATKSITYAELKTVLNFHRTPKVFIKTFMGLFGVLNSVIVDNEVTIGVLPLGGMGIDSPTSVTMIEVAHSNQIVKYRAVGSIYLARQVGGHDTIKISGKLQGPLRLWYLTALWILTLLSQGYWQTIDWESDLVQIVGAGNSPLDMRSGVGGFLPTQKVDNIITQKPAYEKHITYPVITEHEIITNAYIETFSFEEKIERGLNIITYDLMMRTYVEPTEFLADKKRSILRIAKEETKTEQVIKFGLNFTYRMIQMGKESLFNIDNNSWKVDNYYELDAYDVGFTMMLAMAGAVVG